MPPKQLEESPPSPLARVIGRAIGITYGLISLIYLGFWAVWDGYIFRRPGSAFWKHVDEARQVHWNLSTPPFLSFSHHFYPLAPTRQLHYLANASSAAPKHKHLVVFLHGWPDSCMVWRHILTQLPASLSSTAKLIAPDLPGYGGSDTAYPDFGPEGILEPLATFVLAMRERYLDESDPDAKVILVAHDWGASIAYRLAAEAPQLADRFIIINGVNGPQLLANMGSRVKTAVKLVKQYFAAPTRFRLLASAGQTLRPALMQLRSSSYIAIYNMPAAIPAFFGWLGSAWFLRFAASLAAGSQFCISTADAATHFASSVGPPASALDTATADGHAYGADVRRRVAGGRFFESIRMYREGLIDRRWDKSLELAASLHALDRGAGVGSGAGLLEDGPPGALRAPVVVVWGNGDIALQREICVEGSADYALVPGSYMVDLKDVAHWVPSDGRGPGVVAKMIEWSVGGEKEGLERVIGTEKNVVVKKLR